MQRIEKFAPSILVDGQTVTPDGWMWVVGFALAGCGWAIKEANDPEFRKRIAGYMLERNRIEGEQEIFELEQRIDRIRNTLVHNAVLTGGPIT